MIVSINTCEFEVTSSELDIYWADVSKGEWEPQSFRILDYFLSEKSSFIDIGSWVGPLSLYASCKGCAVHAIDPDPVAISMLKKNLDINESLKKNVSVSNIGISSKNSKINLYVRKDFGHSSSSLLPRVKDNFSIVVNTLTFEEFVKRNDISKIDLIKMDIEGGEWKTLPNMTKALMKFDYPTLYISTHYFYLIESFIEKNIPSKWVGKLVFKIANIFSLKIFRKQTVKVLNDFMSISKNYKYIYDSNGNLLTVDFIRESKFLYQNTSLVFSNKLWKA